MSGMSLCLSFMVLPSWVMVEQVDLYSLFLIYPVATAQELYYLVVL